MILQIIFFVFMVSHFCFASVVIREKFVFLLILELASSV
uniref:Uncharacterized protein n=1 Tax=Rhizophora mucronata TaxID=61149 RepID=A0A2P2PCJ7_RHIMU